MSYWLLKSEPDVYSIDDLVRDGKTAWDGVRNHQAKLFLRDQMKLDDLGLFYHSSTDPMGVVGLVRVSSASYPDPTQFVRKSPYFDADAKKDDPRWFVVDVELVEKFQRIVTLKEMKSDRALDKMMVTQRGSRLSVQPVAKDHMKRVLRMAGSRTTL